MVGGNTAAEVVRSVKSTSKRGIRVESGIELVMSLKGWIDYQSGQNSHTTFNAELANTTHVFLCDYDAKYAALRKEKGLSLVIDGNRYEVLLVDDPMGLHQHIETFLRRVD